MRAHECLLLGTRQGEESRWFGKFELRSIDIEKVVFCERLGANQFTQMGATPGWGCLDAMLRTILEPSKTHSIRRALVSLKTGRFFKSGFNACSTPVERGCQYQIWDVGELLEFFTYNYYIYMIDTFKTDLIEVIMVSKKSHLQTFICFYPFLWV